MKTFLRDGSIKIYSSLEGFGTPPGIEDYPFQQLDLPWATDHPYDLSMARQGYGKVAAFHGFRWHKYAGQFTPLGTSVASLAREGGDMLAASCGNCQQPLQACRGLCAGVPA